MPKSRERFHSVSRDLSHDSQLVNLSRSCENLVRL
jgi:hypothetical protein